MRSNLLKRSLAVVFLVVLLCSLTAFTAFAEAPVITKDLPNDLAVGEESSVTLSIEATGEGLTYQWYEWQRTPIEGANTASLSVSSAMNGKIVFCEVSNADGETAASKPCTITGIAKPVITRDLPANVSLKEGDTLTLAAEASGTGVSYQWYTDKNIISGATGSTLSVKVTADYNDCSVFCQMTDSIGQTVSTSLCKLSVTAAPTPTPKPEAPVITKHPYGETVDQGGRAVFIAHADGAKEVSWRFIKNDNSTTYEYNKVGSLFPRLSVSGGDTDTLTLTNIPYEMNGWKAACVFKGDGGETVTDGALITVIKDPTGGLSIQTQPKGATMAINENEDFVLSVQASSKDGGTFSYQWFGGSTNTPNAMDAISGATNSSYKPERKEGTMYYRVGVRVDQDGKTSDMIYSYTVAVTFTESTAHEHSYSSAWDYNDISHWHQCTCGDHSEEAFHSFDWTVTTKPTKDTTGSQHGVCSVCGYETDQPIPAGTQIEGDEAAEEETARGGHTVLLVVLGIAALGVIGAAVYLVLRVLKKEN